jgi:hypothetical protein
LAHRLMPTALCLAKARSSRFASRPIRATIACALYISTLRTYQRHPLSTVCRLPRLQNCYNRTLWRRQEPRHRAPRPDRGSRPFGLRSLPRALPNFSPDVAFDLQNFRPGRPQWRPILMIGPRTMGYNVSMSIEEDESPSINDQQPPEADDQFDEDLMRELSRRPHQSSDRQPSRPQ